LERVENVRFFLPEWDDLVDPKYDFLTDTYSKQHSENSWQNDTYIWQVFESTKLPIDGVLTSRTKISENPWKESEILKRGIHNFLRLPAHIPAMCDCGAWGYINKEKPPFRTDELLEYYLKGRFNIGVSIDHLVVESIGQEEEKSTVEGEKKTSSVARKLTSAEKRDRWKTTIDMACEMYDLWSSNEIYRSSFRIMGAIQGWDVPSYREAARQLLAKGYDYIGLGGLARSATGVPDEYGPSKTVYNVARGVCYEVRRWMSEHKNRVDVHIFGFARPQAIPFMMKIGITSFDSASPMRSAWIGASNYFLPTGEYTAIRIPDFQRSPKAKGTIAPLVREMKKLERKLRRPKNLTEKEQAETRNRYDEASNQLQAKEAEMRRLESEAISSVRLYDKGTVSLDDTLARLQEYNRLCEIHERHVGAYKRTLLEKPWTKCDCLICRTIGLEVVIFRGNERNRRRGFHNTHVFYRDFREKSPRALAFTMCTATKDKSEGLLPAYKRYLASPIFRTFWNSVHPLPVEIGILSAKFGLIEWHTQISDYDCKMEEEDVPHFVEDLKEKLSKYDRVFFIGLGLYREVVRKAQEALSVPIEVFPKKELTTRGALDILEYSGQMTKFREEIETFVGSSLLPEEIVPDQIRLDKFS